MTIEFKVMGFDNDELPTLPLQVPELPVKGCCETCELADECPMPEALRQHYMLVIEYQTWFYEDMDPGSWEEYSIDTPEIEDGHVEWCPLQQEIES